MNERIEEINEKVLDTDQKLDIQSAFHLTPVSVFNKSSRNRSILT